MGAQIANTKKIITILGVGGHGSSAFDDLLNHHTDDEIHLVLGSDDDGGHSGFVRKMLPYMGIQTEQSEFNPMGDIRAIIERFLYHNGTDNASKTFGDRFRTQNMNEFIQKCYEFYAYFGFDNFEDPAGFIDFCRLYFGTALQTEFDLDIKHCIGNLFLSYIQMSTGFNQDAFFNKLKEMRLIPENIFPHFLYSKKLRLEGENLNTKTKFISESEVDEAQISISPSTYTLTDESTDKIVDISTLSQDNPELIEIIAKSEAILLSTGSIANLFGQLNILAPYLREYPGLIMWLGNIAKTRNEADFVEILLYFLQGLHLEGIVMQMNNHDFQNLIIGGTDWLRLYQDQGKDFVNIKAMMGAVDRILDFNGFSKIRKLIQPILGVTLAEKTISNRIKGWDELSENEQLEIKERLGSGGIKYISAEVTLFVDFFYELYNFWLKEVGIENKHQKYEIISEQLERLGFENKNTETVMQEVQALREILGSNLELNLKLQELDRAINQFAGIEAQEISTELVEQSFEVK